METTNDSLALLGGGFSLSVLRFSDASVFFNQGGSDTFCANDSGDDVSVSLSKNSALITGSFDIVKTDLEESSGETENNASYFRSVSGFQNLIVAPKESIGAVQICGDHSVDVSYNASVGTLSSVNRRSRAAFSISSVQNLTIVDIYPTQYDFLTLDLPAAYETREENDLLVITDLETNWSLTIPIGKELPAKNDVGDPSEQTVVSGALFDATNALDEDEALAPSLIDASFAQMGAFDFAEVDVFKLARSLKKGVRTPLRETNWRAR